MTLTAVPGLWDWDERASQRRSLAEIVSERSKASNNGTSYNVELATQGELSGEG
jgi:hypothetical protein